LCAAGGQKTVSNAWKAGSACTRFFQSLEKHAPGAASSLRRGFGGQAATSNHWKLEDQRINCVYSGRN
jgi:hypothetical protein